MKRNKNNIREGLYYFFEEVLQASREPTVPLRPLPFSFEKYL
uniref:Uncharacterized protein n=1 Tax=viral metagenome TaxID=1070528 RepID=A0A6C0JGW8_9ZZZZ